MRPFLFGRLNVMKSIWLRWHFAARWALRHLIFSVAIALISAVLVFGFWYPMPYREMLGVGSIYTLVLAVDVICGPLITLVLANPQKSRPEMILDLSFVGLIQLVALIYGMQAVWIGRPVVLAFERDRMVIITYNEIDYDNLRDAPMGLRELSYAGILKVGTRNPKNNTEFLNSVELSLAGFSPAMRPAWWVQINQSMDEMRRHAKPLSELIYQHPESSQILQQAATDAKHSVETLVYLPLTSSKTKDWIALLDNSMEIVGYAPVDGF